MREVVLYIAMSLDGFLADTRGGVEWIAGQGDGVDADSYADFIREVDTVVMGWNTYHQIVTELSPGRWVYQGLSSYVITHRARPDIDGIHFTAESPCTLVRRLRQLPGKKIWICGGREILQPLLREGLIDRYDLSIIPILLGRGFGCSIRRLPPSRCAALLSTRRMASCG